MSRLFLALILLLAALLRAAYLLQIEHTIDHAYPIWQALSTLESGSLPLVGQSTSVLFANPALTGYLYLPLIALTRSPLSAYILVIALNTLAVLLAFRAIRALLGTPAALVGALLLAVNPWVIEYSRDTWVQSLLPFFTCALAWLLWPLLIERRPGKRLLLALVLLTLLTQTYLLAFLMVAPVGLLLLLYRQQLDRRALVTGGLIFTLALALYGGALLSQPEVVEESISDFSAGPSRLSSEALSHALRLVSGKDYPAARGAEAPISDSEARQAMTEIAHVALTALIALGALQALRDLRRGAILLIWFGVPVLLMSYVSQPVHPFYQLLGLPAGYALAGWGAVTLFRPRWSRALLVGLLTGFTLLSAVNSARYFQATAATPAAHGLDALPLEIGLPLGQLIRDQRPPNAPVIADLSQPWILNSFAGTIFPVQRPPADSVTILPAAGALIVDLRPVTPLAEMIARFPLADQTVLTVARVAPGTLPVPQHPLEQASEQGLTLLGYDLEPGLLTTYWRVDTLSASTGGEYFGPFLHLFDSAGTRLDVIAGVVIPGTGWQAGDIHIHRQPFPVPDTAYTLMIGQYDPLNERNLIFLPDYVALLALSPDS